MAETVLSAGVPAPAEKVSKTLFITCFIALIATSFGFIIRANIIGDLGVHFNLSETQKGEILGVGLWPFALSIILFSLVIDRIGYGRALAFGFVCHVTATFVTIFATGYPMLYWGTFILALGNGTVEAVVNPVVATAYSKDKTRWLNILHAGWPGGMVLGGLLILILMPALDWRWKVSLLLIPAAIYGVMLLKTKFPVQERVKAGVSYKTMLQETGILGAVVVVAIMIAEIGRIFQWSLTLKVAVAAALILAYGLYVRKLGQPLLFFLILIMLPLATAELGTDSWITELVTPVMGKMGLAAGWVLIYTAFIMMILRFMAGPIIHKISPLGLLAAGSAVAVLGLLIFIAATVYALGKSFFWPTMLGVAAERFPKGGALTINAIGGMGMLSVGVLGAVFLGNIQDRQIDRELLANNPALHAQVAAAEKASVFGSYKPLDQGKLAALAPEDRQTVETVAAGAKKSALMTVAIFPAIMLVCFLILIFYFKAKGGYKPVELEIRRE
jgi:MFS family permease